MALAPHFHQAVALRFHLYLYVFSPALGLQQYSCQPDLQVWGSGCLQSESASQKSRKGNQTRLAVE